MTASHFVHGRRAFLAAGLVPLLLPRTARADGSGDSGAAISTRTVILVRHAEKADDKNMPQNPGLSDLGLARADALAELLAHAGVTKLFVSEYRRTHMTLAPLGKALGKRLSPTGAKDIVPLADRIRGLSDGSVAVVAGHSNTVPLLIDALGGDVAAIPELNERGFLAEEAYDRLFLLTLVGVGEDAASRATNMLELRYGEG